MTRKSRPSREASALSVPACVTRYWIRSLGTLLACVLASAFLPPGALAVPALPASWTLVNTDLPLVEDGVLLFHFDAGDYASDAVTLNPSVTDDLGTIMPGVVEMLEVSPDYAIYRFDSTMPAGRTFSVSDTTASLWGSFTSTGPFVAGTPEASVTATAGIRLETQEQVCCAGTTFLSPFGTPAPNCLVLRSQERVQLSVSATLTMNDSSSRQYLYRPVLTAPAEAPGAWRAASQTAIGWQLVSPSEADEYCVRFEAYRLLDGERIVIDERCVAHDLGELGEAGPDEAAIMTALDVRGCLIPPAPLQTAWCEVNGTACSDAASPSQTACTQANYDASCPDDAPNNGSLIDLVPDDLVGSAGAAGSATGGGGAGATTGSGTAGSGAAGMPGSMSSSGGCAVVKRAEPAAAVWLGWLAAACLALARRRRAFEGKGS